MTEPFLDHDGLVLYQGDCLDILAELADASVDAVVTDPPYGINFMGRAWDGRAIEEAAQRGRDTRREMPLRLTGDPDHPERRKLTARTGSAFANRAGEAGAYDFSLTGNRSFQQWVEQWSSELLRVLKPGGHALVFGGTRTYHRLAAGIEDAGFEIRDCLAWMYGSGFPKSLDVSKAIDKLGGTPEIEGARDWQGWGTALKPAFEPIVVARKPFPGTVAANVLEHGVGGINVDGCRITYADDADRDAAFPGGATTSHGSGSLAGPRDAQEVSRSDFSAERSSAGRWPANLVLGHADGCVLVGSREIRGDGNWSGATESIGYEGGWDTSNHPRDRRVPAVEQVEVWECVEDCPIRCLDEQSGELVAGANPTRRGSDKSRDVYGDFGGQEECEAKRGVDVGGASRFFYCAKVSRAERSAGIPEGFKNDHPTVKPIDLMRWLVRLVTPPEGVILDPFLGSGTTGCAAALEGFSFVGIDQDEHYLRDIAQHRIAFWREHGEDGLRICAERDAAARERRDREDAGQLALEMP